MAELFAYKVGLGWQSYLYTRSVPSGRIVYIQGRVWVVSGLGGRIVYIQGQALGGRVAYIQGQALLPPRVAELFTYKLGPG